MVLQAGENKNHSSLKPSVHRSASPQWVKRNCIHHSTTLTSYCTRDHDKPFVPLTLIKVTHDTEELTIFSFYFFSWISHVSMYIYKLCVLMSQCFRLWLRLVFPERGNANVCVHTLNYTVIISLSPCQAHRHLNVGSVSLNPHQALSLCVEHDFRQHTGEAYFGDNKCHFSLIAALCLRASKQANCFMRTRKCFSLDEGQIWHNSNDRTSANWFSKL